MNLTYVQTVPEKNPSKQTSSSSYFLDGKASKKALKSTKHNITSGRQKKKSVFSCLADAQLHPDFSTDINDTDSDGLCA
jgi:hypothetical protein